MKITRKETNIQIVIEKNNQSTYLMTDVSNDNETFQFENKKQAPSINHSFKFASVDEAKEWYQLICTFIILTQQEQD